MIYVEEMLPFKTFLNIFRPTGTAIRKHWALFHLKDLPLMVGFTNNRSEGTNSLLKREIGRNKDLTFVVKKLIALENRQNDKRIRMNSYSRSSIFLPTNVTSKFEYEMILQANNFLSSVCIVKVLEQAKLMNSVKEKLCMDMGQSECPRISGKCHFFKSNMLPCRHLLRVKNA